MMPKGMYHRRPRCKDEVLTSLRNRLLALSIPEPNSGCWLWLGSVVNGPDGLDVLHACDMPCCINPDHLSPGTHSENMADMSRKGRATKGRGTARAKTL